jgi:hypothetical protein
LSCYYELGFCCSLFFGQITVVIVSWRLTVRVKQNAVSLFARKKKGDLQEVHIGEFCTGFLRPSLEHGIF